MLNLNNNKYLAKIICFFGPLIFGVYLIHDNEIVRGSIIRTIYDNKPKNLNNIKDTISKKFLVL